MAMTKYLSRHGNSLALVIERSILQLLGIDERTPLAMTTDGRALLISRRRGAPRKEAVAGAVRRSLRRYAPMHRRLAGK